MKIYANHELTVSLLFMALTLLVAESLFRQSAIREALNWSDSFNAKAAYFAELEEDPEIVMTGNSRVRHGIDTGIIEKVASRTLKRKVISWNFGWGGEVGQPQLGMILRALEGKTPPKVALMFVAPTDFIAVDNPKTLTQKILVNLWKPGDLPSVIRAGATAEEALQIFVCASLETMRHRDRLLDWMLHDAKIKPKIRRGRNGFFPFAPVSEELQRKRAIGRQSAYRRELEGPKSSLSEFKLGSLREALRRLKAAGSKPFVIESPASEPIRSLEKRRRSVIPEFRRRVGEIAAQAAAPFLNHSAAPPLKDAHFVDGDHLSRVGAAIYTKWLMEEVVLKEGFGVSP